MNSSIDWSDCAAVEQHANRVSGAWVFAGTRVPLSALFENLKDGASVEDVDVAISIMGWTGSFFTGSTLPAARV